MRESAGLRHGTRIVVVVAVVLVGLTLLLAVYSSVRANHAAAERKNRLDPAETIAAELHTAIVRERSALRGYMISDGSDRALLDPYYAALTDIDKRATALRAVLADFPDLLALVDNLRTSYQRWQDAVVVPELSAMAKGQPAVAQALELGQDSDTRFNQIGTDIRDLKDEIAVEQADAAQRVEASSNLLLTSFGTVVVLLLAMAALLLILSRRWLIVPINELRFAVNAVAAGRHDTTIPAVGPREIVDLAGNVEAMRAQLVSLVRQNERFWEALAQEGPAVLALRDALTPSSLRDTAGLELRGRVDPAEGELAGDWFDAFETPDGRVAVVVGDVAGHGATCGVFALRLKQLLTAALSRGAEPATAVQWVVEALGDTGETFATALVALVDPGGGEVVYANAGHPDALVLRAGTRTYLEDDPDEEAGLASFLDLDDEEALDHLAKPGDVEPLASTGPLMSSLVAEPGAWRLGRLRLDPGDVLFVYTDGLIEARDGDNRLFGRSRLVEELVRVDGRPPGQLLEDVFAAVRQHAPGRPSDDRTAIALALDPRSRAGSARA
ncbi:SpoIIE family protein phosphatase [Frankia sp. CNm7]|uniref:SpoIIE family protein phosphatase n=1 Tax=Frankia nepalensis TaxID=1836974 RepID=A0A937UJN5_9ACTN|nr:SpoIIE family protein phosphatase [Frankia nepalensis]MBL7495408.1 SpoIIE family protein phosphatase [Frankia nepalensis]MBL7514840.1 SpoIIE family protein phosphatase [Frankia nepalensis]MBL7522427.1 SpoIIE family protein phosphatase [Frankia nepalensis]MBL7625964.1 SpoIIE family protein phosphatase [Frankia nepalensis]